MVHGTNQNLADELAAREVLTRYARAIDRADLSLLKSVYWPDAHDDHIIFSGNAMDFADFIIPMLSEHTECTMHMLGNMWFQFHGDEMLAETYVQAYHRLRDEACSDVIVGGRYLDRLTRRQGEWRIATRQCVFDWQQNAALLLGGEGKMRTMFATGNRGRNDASYHHFASR
jgi:hypothetical protein